MGSPPSEASRYRAFWLGERWVVIDEAAGLRVTVGKHEYASYASAARAAKRLNERERAAGE